MRDERPVVLFTLDTEASTVDDEKGTYAVLYSWDAVELLVDPGDVDASDIEEVTRLFEGRDCESMYEFFDSLVARSTEEDVLIKVAVHNLSYDFMFMRRWLELLGPGRVDVTAKSSTRLLKVSIGDGKIPRLAFFDTLSIFGYSLRQLGENLGYHKASIDYDRAIAPDTALGSRHVEYNRRDVYVLMLGICKSLLTRDGVTLRSLGHTVLTKTGIVRVQDRESSRIGALPVSKRRSIYDEDRMVVARHMPSDEASYLHWCSYGDTMRTDVKGCYAGGVNLSNASCLGKVLHDVHSVDLKSAYPAIMVSYKIPSNPVTVTDLDSYAGMLRPGQRPAPSDVIEGITPFWRGTVRFHGLKVRDEWARLVGDTSVTVSMVACHAENSGMCRYVDGYLHDADTLVLTMVTPLFYEICLQYDFERAEFLELDIYMAHEAPTRYSILRTFHHYAEKSYAKSASADNADAGYGSGFISFDEREVLMTGKVDAGWMRDFVLRHKGNLNSLYGIMVTGMVHGTWYLGDDMMPVEIARSFGDVEVRRDGMQWREAGVLIAMYNRYKLVWCVSRAIGLGMTVVYCDTDSVKFMGDWDTLREDLAGFDRRTERRTVEVFDALYGRLNDNAGALGYDTFDKVVSDDVRGLGKFDYEGTYADFYTPGHKKYAYGDGKAWRARCSGYATRVVDDVLAWLASQGLYDVAPMVALGYDVTYHESTDIATGAVTVPGTWVDSRFEALDSTDGDTVHEWHGMTCPGNAIVPIPKVMNDSTASLLNAQRRDACMRNDLRNERLFGHVIAKGDDGYMLLDNGAAGVL